MSRARTTIDFQWTPVAGNGLLDRRLFLRAGLAAVPMMAGTALGIVTSQAEALTDGPWMKAPGLPFSGYGHPSQHENKVVRVARSAPGTTGAGGSRTPIHLLNGTITPNGLHFERHHSGIPEINPDAHRLLIHGLVKRPLVFTLEALARYPMESRIAFIECGGNSNFLYEREPSQLGAQWMHGLVSCAEWTGVKLSTLLDEAGVDPRASWILAEGADAAAVSCSIPIAKAMDDALIALYQNGERVRPANGYPMRLLLPGYEGIMQIKWLRRIQVTDAPTMTRDETSRYTMLLQDGKALQFNFPMECKSVILQPSQGLTMKGEGFYEISGLAWSGYGKITKVEVSTDGGKSWAAAALQEPVLSKALTRFRIPWHWSGGPAVLQSRATDETGYVQPSRDKLIAARGANAYFHFNGITSWAIAANGDVKHVYI